jgi:hypothetical protein
MVGEVVRYWRDGKQSEYWIQVWVGVWCVWVCEVPYAGSLPSKAVEVQQRNRTKLKSVSGV